ncbi:retrovirus-related pol polyprotein from transposon TNT 1-94 [Tanacetum coccineum]
MLSYGEASPTSSMVFGIRTTFSSSTSTTFNLLQKRGCWIRLPKMKGIEFLNKTLNAFFKEEGIEHQTSTPRTPEQMACQKTKRPSVEGASNELSAF